MPKRFFALVAAAGMLAAGLAAQTTTGAAAPPAPVRKPLSPEETAALKNITATFNDPTTTASRMDSTLSDFRQQFPQSTYMESALLLGVRYYRAHSAYLRLLEYGTLVLALDPDNLYTLSTLGSSIPDNVKQTDLDMDQRLSQAAQYDQQVITVASSLLPTSAGLDFQGVHYTAVQGKTLKENLEGPAYRSLGRIASLRQQYPAAVDAFRQALPFETTPARQGQAYYDIGEAEANAQRIPEAQAALAKALELATDGSLLQHLVQMEQEKLKTASDH